MCIRGKRSVLFYFPGRALSCSRSASTINLTSASKLTVGSHLRAARALLGSATSRSTSAGHVTRILDDVITPVQPDVGEGDLAELLHGVCGPCAYDVIVGTVLLQHQPHGSDVVPAYPQSRLESRFPEELIGQPQLDLGDVMGDLAVTNSNPRRGLSWLKRMPETAKRL